MNFGSLVRERVVERGAASFTRRAASFVVTLGLVVSVSSSAHAFCRTMSCEFGEDPSAPCERDPVTECVIEGEPTHWPDSCLTYAVQLDGSPRSGYDADEIQAMVAAAFSVWKSATCPGGGSPGFETVFQGFVTCDRQQTVCAPAAENVNTILFVDEGWPAAESAVAGLTTPLGSTRSGFVIDTDVEFNSTFFNFNPNSVDPLRTSIELPRVLAHELGHFLGLAHSDVPGALMSKYYDDVPMGAQYLTEDDIEGICSIFPPTTAPVTCEPSSPAYDVCSEDEISATNVCALPAQTDGGDGGGCSVHAGGALPGRGAEAAAWLLSAACAALVVLRRRPRSRVDGVTRAGKLIRGRCGEAEA